MKPTSEEARRLLQHYKEASSLGSEQKARLGEVVQQRVLRGDLPRFDVMVGAAATATPSLLQKIWSSTVGKLVLAVAVLCAAGAATYPLLREKPTQAPRAASPAGVRTIPARSSQAAMSSAIAAPEPVAAEPRATKPVPTELRPRAEKSAPSASPPAGEQTVDEEVKLMNAAQAALRAGKAAQALELLTQHTERFPSGKLTTLREVTRMMALCQAGRRAEARQLAANFIAQRPDSPFVERVKTICAQP
jgi:hypothetical protein